jgi:outer membrane protein
VISPPRKRKDDDEAYDWRQYNASLHVQFLNVLFLSLLLAFSCIRALGQCAGKVSSPAAVADCAARETPREGTATLDPDHPYTLAELIDVAEHHNPGTRTIWERAKQKARELGLAKSAYYPELEGLAVFGDQRLINPFPKPLAPRGYTMVEVPIVQPEVTLQYLIFDFGKREGSVTPRERRSSPLVQTSSR